MAERTRIQELERENMPLHRQLEQQEHENAALRAQLDQLRRELEEWKRGQRTRPRRARGHRQDANGKKPGGKSGHVGYGRP